MRYGGNTTCLEVRSATGPVVVFDAGTGIRELGLELAGESLHDIDLVLTHLHLDHIEGLGFFALLFDPECTIRIYGPRPANGSLEEEIAAYLSPPYFPVPFERIDAAISFQEIETDTWTSTASGSPPPPSAIRERPWPTGSRSTWRRRCVRSRTTSRASSRSPA